MTFILLIISFHLVPIFPCFFRARKKSERFEGESTSIRVDPWRSMISRDFDVVGILVVLLCTPGVTTQNENSRFENCTGQVESIEDGQCDALNNIESFDGGDCCPCTCVNGLEYKCGSTDFDCKDEACLDQAIVDQFPDCPGVLLHVGDGDCQGYNNFPHCGYDGGDCCMCTCFDATSCQFILDCMDPGAGDEIYACEIPPHDEPLPC
jgi:hypothetical protein